MSGARQKIRRQPTRRSSERGEASVVGNAGAEPVMAIMEPESPTATMHLMEEVCERENLVRAWQRVRGNKGAPGVDGMTIADAASYLREYWPDIRSQLLSGTYRPQPVKRVEIPMPDGGVRKLGVPCVVDRLARRKHGPLARSARHFVSTSSKEEAGYEPAPASRNNAR
jgi:RNA-directed DNA polymerase